ncbi:MULTISPECIES: hypothetical protein [Tenacibaculum]|uniref:Methyltransferase type 11 n=2 Tax=Tenacibaculum TaxID=104267 RepID=A0ABN5T6I6_9FLAO|nr:MULTISPECIES: hypothetical protein [Tenacibaculum]GFD76916.1 hypothetical protein KUL113_63360 [Tenacibaculum sp. KUL113]GFD91456.1 hypothetical protein KUL154_01890 [Alteromonas sp. KUL154]GFE01479.1 hypothetical protein KUL156_40710 [Alteromonas sp. KUL156]AZJ32987.1 methyltransferase type 11 [Tenacibaculum mesophilum]KAF9659184.1 methyltransferase type 11 [Tenacibaculum mesophilum]
MKLFIYGTDIDTKKKEDSIRQLFNKDNNIINISIDLEDVDNVLRIEATDIITEADIINKVKEKGFNCMELAD